MIDSYSIKLTQFEKTGLIGKIFSTFETRNCSRLFEPIPRSYLQSAIYVNFRGRISIELEKCIYT